MTDIYTISCDVACEHGLIFNWEKCDVKATSITFFGTVYDKDGAHPDPKKVEAIHKMPPPEGPQELQKFLGMTTYLSPFIPSLSTLTAPLQELLKKDTEFTWNNSYQDAFDTVKKMVSCTSVLRCTQACHYPSRCITEGTRSSTPARWMPRCLCLQGSDPNRTIMPT